MLSSKIKQIIFNNYNSAFFVLASVGAYCMAFV